MGDVLEFDKILQENKGIFQNGRLKFQGNNIQFKNAKTNKIDQIQSDDIENIYWNKRSRGYCLKFELKSGSNLRFDGFQESDFGKLEEISSRYLKVPINKTEVSVKGWNWGKTKFTGDSMNFEVDGKLAFDIPLKSVSNTTATKNEGILQFRQNDESAISLMEIRFHIPSSENDVDAAQEFYKNVMTHADIISVEGDAICTLVELNCLTPRGRYDVKFFTDFVDLHGKTFDYKIPYDHILRLFLLPHKDNRQMYFVVALDPPIKQGQTRYPYIIFLFNNDDNVSVELTVSDKTKEKFGDRIDKFERKISGPYHEVVSRVCRAVLDKRITVPGNFTSTSGVKCLPCSYKANSGFLYPLERGFMFVHKPPLHILFQDISAVTFSKGQIKSFDFEIDHKNGTKHMFNGIDKNEQERLHEFVKQKSINVKKSGKDFQSNLQSMVDDDVHDAYAEKMKAEGRERDNAGDEDSDESDDADFVAGSESSDDLDYDSNASIDSSSNEEEGGDSGGEGKKKEAKKRPISSEKDSKKSKSKNEDKGDKKDKKASTNGKKSKPTKSDDGPKPKSKEFIENDDDDSSDD